jgi:hypothetical protein
MTTRQFINMIGEAETGAEKTEDARLRAIGDGAVAGGYYQMHWAWRVDYWPAWAWAVLRMLDRLGLEIFVARHAGKTARELADLYNAGHPTVDPQYDTRCQSGLADLGLPQELFDMEVSD